MVDRQRIIVSKCWHVDVFRSRPATVTIVVLSPLASALDDLTSDVDARRDRCSIGTHCNSGQCTRLAIDYAHIHNTTAFKETRSTSPAGSCSRNLDAHFERQKIPWVFSPFLVSVILLPRSHRSHKACVFTATRAAAESESCGQPSPIPNALNRRLLAWSIRGTLMLPRNKLFPKSR